MRYGQQLTLVYQKLKQDDLEDGVAIEVKLTKSCEHRLPMLSANTVQLNKLDGGTLDDPDPSAVNHPEGELSSVAFGTLDGGTLAIGPHPSAVNHPKGEISSTQCDS